MRPVSTVRRQLVGLSALILTLAVVLLLLGLLPLPVYRHEPVPWEHPRLLDGGRTLQVTISRGHCDAGGVVKARLHSGEIEVRTYTKEYVLPQEPVWERWTSAGCTLEGVFQELEVHLPEPLGDRTAFDPTYGHRELPVGG